MQKIRLQRALFTHIFTRCKRDPVYRIVTPTFLKSQISLDLSGKAPDGLEELLSVTDRGQHELGDEVGREVSDVAVDLALQPVSVDLQ